MDLTDNFYYDDSESMTIDEALDLIIALSHEIPQLLLDIAPEGWSKSSYRRSIHKFNEHSQLLNICKGEAIRNYLSFRKNNKSVPFDYTKCYSYNRYITGEPFPDAIHYNATILFMLCIALCDLSRHLNMVRVRDERVRLFDFYHIHQALPSALSQCELWTKEKLMNIFILDIRDLYVDGDEAPFYNAAFRALKKMGYDWFYFDSNFECIMTNIYDYHQLKWSPSVENDDGMTASEILEEIVSTLNSIKLGYLDPLDEEAICAAINRKPPHVYLLSYLEVYKAAPQKFPLSVSDYKNFLY